ncbi:hypothetical protein Tco_1432289, partial [Tanacetum coccineum]
SARTEDNALGTGEDISTDVVGDLLFLREGPVEEE